jgi:pyruvate formate lyase activating enzyme
MRIAGYLPLSLVDDAGYVCAVVFTQGCPFRCPYCHNPGLIPTAGETEVPEAEALHRIDAHRRMLDSVCVTGGEPCVQPDLPAFLGKLKARGLRVKLDTNGIHPALVRRVVEDGLVDFVAMDLKHAWPSYDRVARTGSGAAIRNCRETFEFLSSGAVAHEFRTTVSPSLHTTEDLCAIAGQLAPGERYALQGVRYARTLDPDHPRIPADLAPAADAIRHRRPDLEIIVRT